MVEIKEIILNNIIAAVQQELTAVQLQMLETTLRLNLRGIRLEEENTELSTYIDDNEYMLKVFAANKKLEGCKIGSIEQYVRYTRNFLQQVNKNYKDVNKDDVKYYLALYSQGVKQNTLANAKHFLSTFFTFAHEEGYISKNPVKTIKGIKPVEVENVYLNLEEETAVRDTEKSLRDRAIIDFLLSTGVRVGELAKMQLDNLNLHNSSITFTGEKNGRERTVYLEVRAKKHLTEYLITRTDNNRALFVTDRKYYNQATGKREVKACSKSAFEDITKSICIKAGIKNKNCTVHVFRKTFATRLAEQGCPLEIIQELLGHSSASVTSRHYVAKSTQRIKREFNKYMQAA